MDGRRMCEPPAAPPAPKQAPAVTATDPTSPTSEAEEKQRAEREHVEELLEKLPALERIFTVHRKIGEGTFSSVWLGSLKRQAHVREEQRRWFAIKHLVPTAHPGRVEQELRCLRDIGGRDNVIGVELCLRQLDTVVLVMPYVPHAKFSEYVLSMDAAETRRYVRALLTALRRVHAHGVIHRDVKPGNFLYDRANQRFQLVDFGLAQRTAHITHKYGAPPPAAAAATRKRRAQTQPSAPPAKRSAAPAAATTPTAVAPAAPPAPLQHLRPDHPKLNRHQSVSTSERLKIFAARRRAPAAAAVAAAAARVQAACACASRAAVCSRCLERPAARAPRAGTQGFRPPEVLLKYQHQTTAVDMWACGVVLLSVLSGRYPFFRAADDASALAEFVSLFGSDALQRAAAALGRQLVCSSWRRGVCVRRLCARLRSRALAAAPSASSAAAASAPRCPHCDLPPPECVCPADDGSAHRDGGERGGEGGGEWGGFPDDAYDLVLQLLALEPRARISAAEALRHPFLSRA